MQRTTAPGSAGGQYVDDNPALGVVGTLLIAADRNATQEEIMAAIEGAGLTPSVDLTQLWQAIEKRADESVQTLALMKNKLINGDFRFWQRGTSLAVTTGQAKYLADRWVAEAGGTSAALTYSQQAFALGQSDVPGEPKNFARVLVTNGGDSTNGVINFAQFVENVRTLAGRKATLSFWAKADAPKSVSVEIGQTFGSGGSPSARVNTFVQKISLTTSWQKFTMTFDVPSITGKTIGSSGDHTSALVVGFWISAGSAYNSRTNSLGIQTGTFDFAKVQLEEGQLYTSFEDRPHGLELALCQRYYEQFYADDPYAMLGVAIAASATTAYLAYQFKVNKRKPVSLTGQSGTFENLLAPTLTGINAATVGAAIASISFTAASGFVAGSSYYIRASNSVGATIQFDADF